jgi:hypothetical protein
MRSATFLLNKHPYAQRAGDTRVSRLLLAIAAESVSVRGLALWSGPPQATPIDLVCVPKPPVQLGRLAVRGLAAGRSLVHGRYLTPELTRAVGADDSDLLIAEHTYMAEAAIAAGRAGAGLLIDAHVLESSVLAARADRLVRAPLRIEAARTLRDELRCVSAAAATVCLGESDLVALRAAGAERVARLDLVLEPAERPSPLAGPPVALFVGDRTWAPNAASAHAAAALWPAVAARVPDARLVIAGRPARRERPPRVPGVGWLGFVEDVDALYDAATVLLAPVDIGGGVRVKILEAAARGLPVVATSAGLGSIAEYLPIRAAPDFGEAAVRLLGDRRLARATGAELFEASRALWRSGFVHRAVEAWLGRGRTSGGDR